MSIILVHASTVERDERTKDIFHELPERTIEIVPKQDMKIVCSNFNVKIGKNRNFRPMIGQ